MWAASMPFAGVLPLVQLGHYGGMADEIDALKRDKNVLMLELVRLRQQQQVRCWALCEPYVVAGLCCCWASCMAQGGGWNCAGLAVRQGFVLRDLQARLEVEPLFGLQCCMCSGAVCTQITMSPAQLHVMTSDAPFVSAYCCLLVT
mgnify:CR=1 FL=1